MTILGSLGIGAVWGWLLVLVAGRHPDRPLPKLAPAVLLALLLVSGGLGTTVALFSDPWHALYFALAAAIFAVLHLALLAQLRAGVAEKNFIQSLEQRR